MKKYILFSIIVLAALWVLGSVTAQAATINAASCSQADVQNAVNSAREGDTVSVPAGNCTWASKLTITKGINLIGAGIGSTVITNGLSNHDYLIQYTPSNYDLNTPIRISGFSFNLNNNGPGILFGTRGKGAPFTIQTKGRIDHNRFYNATYMGYQAIWNNGDIRGVVDNNAFDSVAYPIRSDAGVTSSWWMNFSLVQFGAADDNLYFEDNTFTDMSGGTLSDCQWSGRYIFRYNTIGATNTNGSYPLLDMHGNQPNGMYACFGGEVYGNNVTIGLNKGTTLLSHRGGKALLFYNYVVATDGAWTVLYEEYADDSNSPVPANTQTINDTYYWSNWQSRPGVSRIVSGISTNQAWVNGLAEDVNFWQSKDSFNGTSGVGCGTLASRPATCTTGVGYWATNQSCTSNLAGLIGANPTTPLSGTLYKCTSTNNWTSWYTPYTYPHPLRSETPQTCTYTYSAWGACQSNGIQTRTVVSSSPSGCTGTPILTQSCVYTNFLPEQYIQAESGQLSSMQTGVSGSDTYIYTPTDNTGSVSFVFNILTAGQYKMEALVNSNNDAGQNSFYLGLDSENPQNNNYYAYSTPVTSGFVWDNVNRTGNGTALPEFDPIIWDLTVGLHTFTFYGRESNTWLDQIILKRVTADTTPPAAPNGVSVN